MKSPGLNIEDLFNIPNAEIFKPEYLSKIYAVSADSRRIPEEALFVAIKGQNFDGHNFIKEAVDNGASAVMVNRSKAALTEKLTVPAVVVDDTVKALGIIASVWRMKLSTKVIALTGSAGKTTTKEMLASVLSEKFRVNKTKGNNNNHLGVPFTLLDTDNSHEILITELGTNHFGEIEYTAEMAKPDYALITNIGFSHLEFFKDLKGVIKEKGVLFDVTAENGGFIFVNADDPHIRKYTINFQRMMTYGLKGNHDVTGDILSYDNQGNPEVEVSYRDKKLKVTIPSPGEQAAQNFIAVCAVAFRFGMSTAEIVKGIKKFSDSGNRLNVKKKKDFILIDDSYNANPDSMRNSISLLTKMESTKRILVLGDMFELGADAADLHKKLARFILKCRIDEIYTTGSLMKHLQNELDRQKVVSRHFDLRQELKEFLKEKEFTDSVVLVKGSRGMKMEEFVEVLEARK